VKIILASVIAAFTLIAGINAASAQASGGTGRPSYDNPRAYDRDAQGNETYYRRNTYFGPRYYDDDEDRPVRRTKKTVKKKQYYDDDDD
jgi:hypothetical protein